MCVNISSINRIFSNQSHYFPDIPCIPACLCRSRVKYIKAPFQYLIDSLLSSFRQWNKRMHSTCYRASLVLFGLDGLFCSNFVLSQCEDLWTRSHTVPHFLNSYQSEVNSPRRQRNSAISCTYMYVPGVNVSHSSTFNTSLSGFSIFYPVSVKFKLWIFSQHYVRCSCYGSRNIKCIHA